MKRVCAKTLWYFANYYEIPHVHPLKPIRQRNGERAGPPAAKPGGAKAAWRFVVALGIVSLFADMTYEGARSIAGAYLFQLGASALVAGAVGGGAEFLGYAVRWLSGRGADAGGRHWLLMYIGYALNLIAVPCLALTSSLGSAAGLIVGERLGKGIRTPPRDALIARAGSVVGHGISFGVHELLDQLGALAGPLLVAALVAMAGYRAGFAVLAIPAAAAFVALAAARRFEVRPQPDETAAGRLPRIFWRWLVFATLATAGFSHFTLVAFALAARHFTPALIPVLFAFAMGAEGIAALISGHLSDRLGRVVLAGFPLCGIAGVALLFVGPSWASWLGAFVWGTGLGIQGATLRARIAREVPEGKRGEAFGIFDTAIGMSWLGGSVLLGALYPLSAWALVLATVVLELAALVWLAGTRPRTWPGRSARP